MSLKDSLFLEDVERDVTLFARDKKRKRVLVFPPVNNYRRFLIHQFVQEQYNQLLQTFSIGEGDARRTVLCYKDDLIRNPKLDVVNSQLGPAKQKDTMGVEGQQRSPSTSPAGIRTQRTAKPTPKVEIYRPPAARKAKSEQLSNTEPIQSQSTLDSPSIAKGNRQRRPDRAVYVPRHRRSLETEGSPQPTDCSRPHRTNRDNSTSSSISPGSSKPNLCPNIKDTESLPSCKDTRPKEALPKEDESRKDIERFDTVTTPTCEHTEPEVNQVPPLISNEIPPTKESDTDCNTKFEQREQKFSSREEKSENDLEICDVKINCERTKVLNTKPVENETRQNMNNEEEISIEHSLENVDSNINVAETQVLHNPVETFAVKENDERDKSFSNRDKITNEKNTEMSRGNKCPDVLIISDNVTKKPKIIQEVPVAPIVQPEKKVRKIVRPKSKPAPPPAPMVKINRDECDWDSLFDDNGDCLDPTLIEELTSAVGEVAIEQPKNDYKPYTKNVEVSSDEFGHVVEIYNFPSDFKTSDLAAVFSPFKNGGFELKWVDDTHCLGVFSSPLIAAEVLASDHAFVKTRPLSEATALSKTKAKRSAEFLQPYRTRPETCAALARRLVTGALGVKLATARQEREHEKNVLREAKEKRRLANKQREDVWEGIIPEN